MSEILAFQDANHLTFDDTKKTYKISLVFAQYTLRWIVTNLNCFVGPALRIFTLRHSSSNQAVCRFQLKIKCRSLTVGSAVHPTTTSCRWFFLGGQEWALAQWKAELGPPCKRREGVLGMEYTSCQRALLAHFERHDGWSSRLLRWSAMLAICATITDVSDWVFKRESRDGNSRAEWGWVSSAQLQRSSRGEPTGRLLLWREYFESHVLYSRSVTFWGWTGVQWYRLWYSKVGVCGLSNFQMGCSVP